MAYVYKKGPTWYIGFKSEAGQHVREATRAQSKTEAKRLAQEAERRAERIRMGVDKAPGPRMTLAQVVDAYQAGPMLKLARTTRENRQSILKTHVLPNLGARQMEDVAPDEIDRFLATLPLAEGSRRCVRTVLAALFNFAVRKLRLLAVNPMAAVDPINIVYGEPLTLTVDEMLRLFAEVPEKQRAYFITAGLTGIRKTELDALPKANVNLETRMILVERNSTSDTTKGKKPRRVPIPAMLMPALREQMQAVPGPLVFPSDRTGKMRHHKSDLSGVFRRAMARAGIEKPGASFKTLRASFATLVDEAAGIEVAQAILGHFSKRTTEKHYIARRDQPLIEAVDRIHLPSHPVLTGAAGDPSAPLIRAAMPMLCAEPCTVAPGDYVQRCGGMGGVLPITAMAAHERSPP